jgi:menaquinone-specific isochorismate synthase
MSSIKGDVLLGWGKRTWYKAPSKEPKVPSYYFPDFFLEKEEPWFTHEHNQEISIQELIECIKKEIEISAIKSSNIQWRNPYYSKFQSTFKELKSKFQAKELDKAVPYVFEIAEQKMERNQLIASLKSLLTYSLGNPVHIYGFWDKTGGMLGATPEILFKFINSKTLETVACAGTINARGDVSTLLTDPKELHEHQLVVDGMREALSPFGTVRMEPIHLLRLSRLVHLATPILAELNSHAFTFEQIVKALHPTPAVGTFPSLQGKQWLAEYQTEIERGRFGAPSGFVFPKNEKASCYVSIRNVQWTEKALTIGAGCGVVAESDCEREWAEINLKLQAIKEMLAL